MKELYQAYFEASKEIETLKKDSKGYGYNYLSLEALINYVKPILARHGLFIIQTVGSTEKGSVDYYDSTRDVYKHGKKIGEEQNIKTEIESIVNVNTSLVHAESGQVLEKSASIPLTDMKGVNRSQATGSAITYLRRYSITALCGIAENDTDGLTKEEVKSKKKKSPLTPEQKKHYTDIMNFYGDREDFKRVEFIEDILDGKLPATKEYLKRIDDAYKVDLTKKVFESEKQLDNQLQGVKK